MKTNSEKKRFVTLTRHIRRNNNILVLVQQIMVLSHTNELAISLMYTPKYLLIAKANTLNSYMQQE